VSDQDLPNVSKAILTQDANSTVNHLDTELEFIVAFGNRIPEGQRTALINEIVSNVKMERNEYSLTDARMEALSGMLSPEAARQMVDTILKPSGVLILTLRLPLPTARMLSWLAKYLTEREGAVVERSLMNGLATLKPGIDQEQIAALKRLSENLPLNPASAYTEDWAEWALNWDPAMPIPDEVLSVALHALQRLRGRFDRTTVSQIFKSKLTDAPIGMARKRLSLIAAVGGLDFLPELKPDVLTKWLDEARFEYDYASSPLTALDREVISKLRSLKIVPRAGATTGPSQRYSAGQQWLIRGMEPGEWATFLNSVPRSPEGLDMLITLLDQVDRDQASQVFERILQQLGASGFGRRKISNLSWAVDGVVNRDPLHKLALPKLASYLLALVEGSSEDARLEAAEALADLNLPLTPAQRTRVSRILIRGVESPEQGAEYAGAVASFHDSLTAAESARVVEVLYRRFEQAQAGGYAASTALPLARMAPFLTTTQTQAILKILPRDPDGLWNSAKTIAALAPALDSGQIEAILSGLQSRLMSYGSAMPGGLAATLAAKLPPDRRRSFVQPIIEAPEKRRERPSLTEANLLWSLWPIMEPTQRERSFRLILQSVAGDTSGMYGDRPLPDFVRAAASIPGGNERLKTALLQTLENRRPGQIGFQDVLRIIHQLDGRTLSRQELFNIVKWPTLQPWAQQELISVLTKDGNAPAGQFTRARAGSDALYERLYRNDPGVEIDWWSISKWAAARGLDLSPPTRPAGYQ
jgi:hypothetical protein